jgi:uncharacterized protein (TIGR03067 family)
MRSTGWFLGLLLLLGAAEPFKDDAKNDADSLQGGWTMALAFINGEELPAEQAKSAQLVIEDDRYHAKLGAAASTSTIKVDASKSPKEIDLTFIDGDQKGKTVKGIYKLSGDDLTICRGLTEMEARPTDFAAPVDSGLLLVTWKRSKTVVSEKTKAINEELKRFEATWRFVEIEVGGRKIPEKAFEKDALILKGKRFASFVAGKLVHGDFKIDPVARPKAIDIIFTEGPGKGRSQKGIYELEGDTQRICFAMPDKPRPTEFVTRPDNEQIIEVLKREKN